MSMQKVEKLFNAGTIRRQPIIFGEPRQWKWAGKPAMGSNPDFLHWLATGNLPATPTFCCFEYVLWWCEINDLLSLQEIRDNGQTTTGHDSELACAHLFRLKTLVNFTVSHAPVIARCSLIFWRGAGDSLGGFPIAHAAISLGCNDVVSLYCRNGDPTQVQGLTKHQIADYNAGGVHVFEWPPHRLTA